jgi:hypothetical protein
MEVNSPPSGNPTWNTRSDTAPAGLYALGVLAKDNVFAGRTRLYSLDSRLGGLQISNGFNPFELRGVCLFQNVDGGFHGQRLFATNRAT